MVVTQKFIYIHLPKTGGTFVTTVLDRLHRRVRPARSQSARIQRVIRATVRRSVARRERPQEYGPILDLEPKHGTCHDIPSEFRHLPILSTIRNPYDWYVSQYEFGWWKRTFLYKPELYPTPVGEAIERALPSFIDDHPSFPDIGFEGFMELCERAMEAVNGERGSDVGLYTYGFLRFYHREPEALRGTSGSLSDMRDDIFEVEFLFTHRLNEQLYRFLLATGYERKDLAFISELDRILPMGRGRREDQLWSQYYTSELKSWVRERDRLLFERFPEFDLA